jgi:DNA topoisomerase-3
MIPEGGPDANLPYRKCPACNLDMTLRRRKDNGFFFSCMGFPECKTAVWLPAAVQQVEVDAEKCNAVCISSFI